MFSNNREGQVVKLLISIPVLGMYIKNKFNVNDDIRTPPSSATIESVHKNTTPYIYIVYSIFIILIIYKIFSIYLHHHSLDKITQNIPITNLQEKNNYIPFTTKNTNIITKILRQMIDNTLNLDILYTFDPLIIGMFYSDNMWILSLKVALLMYRYKYMTPYIKNVRFFGDTLTKTDELHYNKSKRYTLIMSPIYITNIVTLVLDIYMGYISHIQMIVLSLINSNILAFLISSIYKMKSKIVYWHKLIYNIPVELEENGEHKLFFKKKEIKYYFFTDKEIILFLIKIGIIAYMYPYNFLINIFLINADYLILGIVYFRNVINNKYYWLYIRSSVIGTAIEIILSLFLKSIILFTNNNHIMYNYIFSNITNYDDSQRA